MAELDWSQIMPQLLAGKSTTYIKQNRLQIAKYLKDKFNLVLDQDLHLRAYSNTRPVGIEADKRKQADPLLYRVYYETLARLASLQVGMTILYQDIVAYINDKEGLSESSSVRIFDYLKPIIAKLENDGILELRDQDEKDSLYVLTKRPVPHDPIDLTSRNQNGNDRARQELLLNGFYRRENFGKNEYNQLQNFFEPFYNPETKEGLRLVNVDDYYILLNYSQLDFPNTVQSKQDAMAIELIELINESNLTSFQFEDLAALAKQTQSYQTMNGSQKATSLKVKLRELLAELTYYGLLSRERDTWFTTSLTKLLIKDKETKNDELQD
ncbi:hypothetical protein [Lactobacillus sp.]|uniref:hypothetical protein n=1 Tax=Lactobacillus sp. TaxID=1591 RepID=UPI003EF8C50D